MPGTDIYGQEILLALVSDTPNGQTLAGDLAKGILAHSILVYNSAAHRGATMVGDAAPVEGMVTYLRDSNALEFYNGSAWRPLQEALPSLPRGSIGYQRSFSGTGSLTGATLVSGTSITFTCSTSRRYRVTADGTWLSSVTGLGAGLRFGVGYIVGPTLPSNGAGTFEIVGRPTGAAAVDVSVFVGLQHEFNGPTSNQITAGVFANPTAGTGNRMTVDPTTLSIHDIGPAQ